MPLFSVITITKGNPDGFARTRASVEAQIFKDIEWVVVDGDKEPDNGIYDAMNKGCARSCGEYLIFMNAGDVFASHDVLARIAPALSGRPDFVYGDALEGGHYKPARHDIARGMVTHHQAMVFKNSSLRYDTRYRIAADYKFTAQTMMEAATMAHLPFAFCEFEQGGISQRRAEDGQREQAEIRRELGLHALGVDTMQRVANFLKNRTPKIYWALRSRRNTSRA